MQNKRRYVRRSESMQMSVKPPNGETKTYTTRDIGDGGIFLFALTTEQLPVGTTVVISSGRHVAGIAPPTIRGRVIRSSAQGMAIEFIVPGFS